MRNGRVKFDATGLEGDYKEVESYKRTVYESFRWGESASLSVIRKAWRREFSNEHIFNKYDIEYILKGNRWLILKKYELGGTLIVMPREDANIPLERKDDYRPILGSYDILTNEFRLNLDGQDVLISTSLNDLASLYNEFGKEVTDCVKRIRVSETQMDRLLWVDSAVVFV